MGFHLSRIVMRCDCLHLTQSDAWGMSSAKPLGGGKIRFLFLALLLCFLSCEHDTIPSLDDMGEKRKSATMQPTLVGGWSLLHAIHHEGCMAMDMAADGMSLHFLGDSVTVVQTMTAYHFDGNIGIITEPQCSYCYHFCASDSLVIGEDTFSVNCCLPLLLLENKRWSITLEKPM